MEKCLNSGVKLTARICELRLANPWKIASSKGSGIHRTVIVELTDASGLRALGEAAPSSLYGESAEGVLEFLSRLDPSRLAFGDVAGSMAWLEAVPGIPAAARCALNLALLDGAAKQAGQPLCDFLGLGFREHHHVTSFSIGIDAPDIIHKKVLDAAPYPVLKLKVGDPRDRENFAALRAAAPDKPVRVDANEGWKTKEDALEMIEWLVADGCAHSVRRAADAPGDSRCRFDLAQGTFAAAHFRRRILPHGQGHRALRGVFSRDQREVGQDWRREHGPGHAAGCAQAGLKTMIGCMIETSVMISAAAHLAELADFLDIDGNLLITNDPFAGVTAELGILSFATAREKHGLRVNPRAGRMDGGAGARRG